MSNAELLSIIGSDEFSRAESDVAKYELKKRNLTKTELKKAEKECKLIIENKKKRKNQRLSLEEKLLFFFIPFGDNALYQNLDISEDEFERFKKHGFKRKYKDAFKYKAIGTLMYIFVYPLLLVIFLRYFIFKL